VASLRDEVSAPYTRVQSIIVLLPAPSGKRFSWHERYRATTATRTYVPNLPDIEVRKSTKELGHWSRGGDSIAAQCQSANLRSVEAITGIVKIKKCWLKWPLHQLRISGQKK